MAFENDEDQDDDIDFDDDFEDDDDFDDEDDDDEQDEDDDGSEFGEEEDTDDIDALREDILNNPFAGLERDEAPTRDVDAIDELRDESPYKE